ncbi:hypothetical protein Pmani_017162, partial [Petrolisthes manimaculis]
FGVNVMDIVLINNQQQPCKLL